MSVYGVGGVFIKSKDPDARKAWYRDRLGMTLNEWGGFDFLHSASSEKFGGGARTIFSHFKADHDYFDPSPHPAMINLIVDDLDTLVEQLEAAGETMIGEPISESYGKFAWVMDPDGFKIELWQPPEVP